MNFVWAIALLVLAYTVQALTAKKSKSTDATAATIAEFQLPQHEEGTPQAVIFGDVWTDDWMVLYYGNLSTEAIRVSTGGGGKK